MGQKLSSDVSNSASTFSVVILGTVVPYYGKRVIFIICLVAR